MSLAAQGQEIIELAKANPFVQPFLEFVKTNEMWTPAVTALLTFFESIPVIGFFVPATVILVAIGALVGVTDIPFLPVWAGTVAGALGGDVFAYWIGDKLKYRAVQVWPLSRYPGSYARGEKFFRKWGIWGIFFGRFFGPVRGTVPLVAGIFEMPFVLFMAASIASAMLWAFVLLAPGFAALQVLRY